MNALLSLGVVGEGPHGITSGGGSGCCAEELGGEAPVELTPFSKEHVGKPHRVGIPDPQPGRADHQCSPWAWRSPLLWQGPVVCQLVLHTDHSDSKLKVALAQEIQ